MPASESKDFERCIVTADDVQILCADPRGVLPRHGILRWYNWLKVQKIFSCYFAYCVVYVLLCCYLQNSGSVIASFLEREV